MGLKDQGAAAGTLTITHWSGLSTEQNQVPGVIEASSISHSKTKQKDKSDTKIILIFIKYIEILQ